MTIKTELKLIINIIYVSNAISFLHTVKCDDGDDIMMMMN